MAIDRPLFSVFPTCVGVILCGRAITSFLIGISHMRGGDPLPGVREVNIVQYSPHAWG